MKILSKCMHIYNLAKVNVKYCVARPTPVGMLDAKLCVRVHPQVGTKQCITSNWAAAPQGIATALGGT
jgi:MinD superfamily P-loop ATPase